ncbi:uncharacterized protein G2W53_006568 [Senna tora]|uniref:Uncharacterized protein n=1 Tax=Senna tora TaxID=362788 RepID=A0A834X4B7_9FABA|nr:uncharacterized protein G2W53_006568 [Senna tora]
MTGVENGHNEYTRTTKPCKDSAIKILSSPSSTSGSEKEGDPSQGTWMMMIMRNARYCHCHEREVVVHETAKPCMYECQRVTSEMGYICLYGQEKLLILGEKKVGHGGFI